MKGTLFLLRGRAAGISTPVEISTHRSFRFSYTLDKRPLKPSSLFSVSNGSATEQLLRVRLVKLHFPGVRSFLKQTMKFNKEAHFGGGPSPLRNMPLRCAIL